MLLINNQMCIYFYNNTSLQDDLEYEYLNVLHTYTSTQIIIKVEALH